MSLIALGESVLTQKYRESKNQKSKPNSNDLNKLKSPQEDYEVTKKVENHIIDINLKTKNGETLKEKL